MTTVASAATSRVRASISIVKSVVVMVFSSFSPALIGLTWPRLKAGNRHNGKGREALGTRDEAAQAPARKRKALEVLQNRLRPSRSTPKGPIEERPDDLRNSLLIDEDVILPLMPGQVHIVQ